MSFDQPLMDLYALMPQDVRLFYALYPDAAAVAAIAAEREQVARALGLRAIVADPQLHLTLCPVGAAAQLRQPLEQALLAAGQAVNASLIEIGLDHAALFNGGAGRQAPALRVDAASESPLYQLRQALVDAQRWQGLLVSGKSFAPHVTLGYGHDLAGLDAAITPIRWTARDFVLIASHQGQSRHEVLGRWPLRD